jgi:flagellar assembly protein FliH
MSSTSRVLRGGQLERVTSVWVGDHRQEPRHSEPAAPIAPAETPAVVDRERVEQEAYQQGLAEGRVIGRQQASSELQPVLERLSRSIAEVSTVRGNLRRQAEKDLVKLSIAIARRVLHRELTLDAESLEGLIKVALEKLDSREMTRVRVHPDQEAMMRTLLSRFGQGKVELVPDTALNKGDVLLDTTNGTIDASVDSQLREIERGLVDRVRT